MSTPLDPRSPGLPLWQRDLAAAVVDAHDWLWHGYVAIGSTTLLTSVWKTGKTTLLSLLLHRLGAGGELAGLTVRPARAVVVSEEAPSLWLRRSERLDFGEHVCWLCRPFASKPTPPQWLGLIDRLATLRGEHGLTLAVIDPLAAFLPGRDENSAGGMLEALLPLRRLTAAGMAVLLLHHPRKGSAADGLTARGSGALSAHADILIEMRARSAAEPHDRRRRLRGFSRYEETPAERVIELNAEGTNYVSLGDAEEESFTRGWSTLLLVLRAARGKLTRAEVGAAWPPDHEAPAPVTLWRWLERAVQRSQLQREGQGTRADPFRYWLVEQEAEWRNDPIWMMQQEQRETVRRLEQLLGGRGGASR